MVTEGGGHVLVNEKTQWPNGLFSTTLLVVSTNFLTAHPAVVTDLLKGQLATTAFLNASPTQAQADANTELATLTGKPLKAGEVATAWSNMTFTNDPIASSILADLVHAKAAGFPTSDIAGIFDLGPINQVLIGEGKAKLNGA
jgi:NitT/TauT family transport system substrate-binding protein